jgi:stage V sporulation protein AB
MAERTATADSVRFYEESIMLGAIAGTLLMFFDFHLPIGTAATVALSFCCGIFFGALAMSLAEVLDVIPILTRRGKIERGLYYLVVAIAAGKLVGSLMYYVIPGFFISE